MSAGLTGRGGEGERGAAAAPGSASEGPGGLGGAGPAKRLPGGAADFYSPANQPRNPSGRFCRILNKCIYINTGKLRDNRNYHHLQITSVVYINNPFQSMNPAYS